MKKTINKNKLMKKLKFTQTMWARTEISILTERIKYLTTHFSKNKKINISNTGLNKLIIKRKNCLII